MKKIKRKRQKSIPRVKKKQRKCIGSFIYGVTPVLEALRSENRKIERIFISNGKKGKFISEIFELARKKRVALQHMSNLEISSLIGDSLKHQGVIAVSSSASYYDSQKLFKEITESKQSLSLILDGVEDPRNLGAILRTAECAGIDGIFLPKRRSVGLNETVAKSSAGALEHVKIAKVTSINRLIDELKSENVWVIGAVGDGAMDYTKWEWSQPSALVLGSEGKGLHRLTSEKCNTLVKIPMYGRIESLNVSVAAGVILFEAVRQRK